MATLLGHVMSIVLDKSSKADDLIPCYRGDDFMADEVTLREHIPSSPETFAAVYDVFTETASSSGNNDGAEITCCSGTPADIEFSAHTIQIDQPKTQVAKDSVTPKKTNSFSIDSILGNWTIDGPTVDTASPSWLASSSVNYQMQTPDWTIRQI
ncbi:hypothetical protein DPMN_155007 [Dreissena polymorpha]|uniref:Uncharacterized protein n=1 Tax=Dreissena polymorpha TaxID=45954 RepID=A0A9D4FPL5_DREPO|nr:hypothetical protein DPMN_155007 [Dreissena polymorpha]